MRDQTKHLTTNLVAIVVVAGFVFPENFPGVVIAVLLGKENAPAGAEGSGDLGAEQAANAGIAVGFMPSGDFVVAIVLESRHAAKLRVQSCGGVAAFG